MNDITSQVEIDLNVAGVGSVVVNGEDVAPQLDALQVVCESRQSPRVILHEKAGVKIRGEAFVEVVQPSGGVIEFLASVNPQELEERALLMTESVPVAFLEVLKEMAATWQGST